MLSGEDSTLPRFVHGGIRAHLRDRYEKQKNTDSILDYLIIYRVRIAYILLLYRILCIVLQSTFYRTSDRQSAGWRIHHPMILYRYI